MVETFACRVRVAFDLRGWGVGSRSVREFLRYLNRGYELGHIEAAELAFLRRIVGAQ